MKEYVAFYTYKQGTSVVESKVYFKARSKEQAICKADSYVKQYKGRKPKVLHVMPFGFVS